MVEISANAGKHSAPDVKPSKLGVIPWREENQEWLSESDYRRHMKDIVSENLGDCQALPFCLLAPR